MQLRASNGRDGRRVDKAFWQRVCYRKGLLYSKGVVIILTKQVYGCEDGKHNSRKP